MNLSRPPIARLLAVAALLCMPFVVSACSSSSPLPAGLTARMDAPGSALDRVEALNLINQFRRSRGASNLRADPALDALAQQLASQYAQSGDRPSKPEQALHIQVSAGYVNFAETFSGWRGSSADATVIADPAASRFGLASVYSSSSEYGVHWVMLLAGPAPAPTAATVQ